MLFTPDCCANCDATLTVEIRTTLFCGTGCRETAKAVRYARGVFRDGRLEDSDVMRAVDAKFSWALMGGYDIRERRVSQRVRAEVVARDRGRCVLCGAPGAEVDHKAGSSPDPSNLQFLCFKCHQSKTRVVAPPGAEYVFRSVRLPLWHDRVVPDEPVRQCDSAEWVNEWRGLLAERKRRLREAL